MASKGGLWLRSIQFISDRCHPLFTSLRLHAWYHKGWKNFRHSATKYSSACPLLRRSGDDMATAVCMLWSRPRLEVFSQCRAVCTNLSVCSLRRALRWPERQNIENKSMQSLLIFRCPQRSELFTSSFHEIWVMGVVVRSVVRQGLELQVAVLLGHRWTYLVLPLNTSN